MIFIYIACGCIRLARFNVGLIEHTNLKGYSIGIPVLIFFINKFNYIILKNLFKDSNASSYVCFTYFI
jgi:phosphatidylserine synthase